MTAFNPGDRVRASAVQQRPEYAGKEGTVLHVSQTGRRDYPVVVLVQFGEFAGTEADCLPEDLELI
jgi:hypothetical protein